MGTRADFYVGRGKDAEWLGSIAWDGYPRGIADSILRATDKTAFRQEVLTYVSQREDGSVPAQGWPWPWKDSRTTDYSYAFDDGKVWASCYGYEWFDPLEEDPDLMEGTKVLFPDMTSRKRQSLFGPHSGVIVIGQSGPD